MGDGTAVMNMTNGGTLDGAGTVDDISTRMAECSMSSTPSLDPDEVDRLLNEAATRRSWEGGTAGGEMAPSASAGVAAGVGGMSIAADGEGAPAAAADGRQQQAMPVDGAAAREDSQAGGAPLHAQQRRPYDDVRGAGPAEDPIPFPEPQYYPARRADRVLVYNESTGEHFEATDVLFRVQGQDAGDGDCSLSHVERAYWRMPDKVPIETRMGHLEKCHVLKRLPRSEDSDDEEGENAADDDDVVFLLTDERVAIKVNYNDRMQRLCSQPCHSTENPLVEIAALQLVGTGHPNVLGCHEVLFDGDYLSVVMPYCDGGDLHDAVVQHSRLRLPEAEARKWFRQFLEGLRHLQGQGLCHRDLSPENLMIDADRALIIDMGMCLRVPYSQSSVGGEATSRLSRSMHRRLMKPQGQVGKLPYMSPEVYLNREGFDGFAIDLWTAGTILFFLLTGAKYEHPFDVVFKAMTSDLAGLVKHWGMDLSADAIDLIRGLIQVDPRLRLTLDEALHHPWLEGGTA